MKKGYAGIIAGTIIGTGFALMSKDKKGALKFQAAFSGAALALRYLGNKKEGNKNDLR